MRRSQRQSERHGPVDSAQYPELLLVRGGVKLDHRLGEVFDQPARACGDRGQPRPEAWSCSAVFGPAAGRSWTSSRSRRAGLFVEGRLRLGWEDLAVVIWGWRDAVVGEDGQVACRTFRARYPLAQSPRLSSSERPGFPFCCGRPAGAAVAAPLDASSRRSARSRVNGSASRI